MSRVSYGEELCRRVLKCWFPTQGVIYNYRPIWLQNPKTGRNLELDIYLPSLRLAVEFNGAQHKLLNQSTKDSFKIYKCEKVGILLLSVYHPKDLFQFKGWLKRYTGIKKLKISTDSNLSEEIQKYSPTGNTPRWYTEEKKISDLEKDKRDCDRRIRRSIKISLKRFLKPY